MKTFFPLVSTPKSQHKGSQTYQITSTKVEMVRPEYETEAQITRAIATGTFKGNSILAYANAKAWQKQEAAKNKPHFKPKAATTTNRNGKYNHVMFG